MGNVTFREAIKKTLLYELRRNRNTVYISQDIGVFGGAHEVSKGFDAQIDENRLIDAPVSENAYIGLGVGVCMGGGNAVVELPGTKQLIRALDPIVNYALKVKELDDEAMPGSLVIRCPIGYKEFSSVADNESPEAMFCQFPGINVVYPSTPSDAKGFIRTGLRESGVTVILEHKKLYDMVGEVPNNEEIYTKIGKAEVARKGDKVSIITYGEMLNKAINAADRAAKEFGISVEVIDLKTIHPIDKKLIISSAIKTGKVIVAHEASKTGGLGGEICAIINESKAFDYMQAPIKRVAAKDTYIPYSKELAKDVIVSEEDIVENIIDLISY